MGIFSIYLLQPSPSCNPKRHLSRAYPATSRLNEQPGFGRLGVSTLSEAVKDLMRKRRITTRPPISSWRET